MPKAIPTDTTQSDDTQASAPGAPQFDLENELCDLALLADTLSTAGINGTDEAHSALSYASRCLSDHRDRLHRGFEAMHRAHRDEVTDLRAQLAEAQRKAAPGSARAVEQMEAYRRMLLAAAEAAVEQVRAIARPAVEAAP